MLTYSQFRDGFSYFYAKRKVLEDGNRERPKEQECLYQDDYFLDRSDYQLLEMDTDSSYLALAGSSLESLVKPELRDESHAVKNQWLPRSDPPDAKAYDKRTPGTLQNRVDGRRFLLA